MGEDRRSLSGESWGVRLEFREDNGGSENWGDQGGRELF